MNCKLQMYLSTFLNEVSLMFVVTLAIETHAMVFPCLICLKPVLIILSCELSLFGCRPMI